MRHLPRFLISVSVCLAAAPALAQEAWPEFRGSDGAGRIADGAIPTDFSQSNVQWKVPVWGRAWSSPVVWGEQVWVTTATRDGKRMSALCFDLKTGKQLHDVLIHRNESPHFCHDANTYASPTPAIEKDRIFVHFGRYGTSCLDTSTGDILWQRTDIECDHFRGPASSPVLSDAFVMFAMDGIDQQFAIALEKQTGKTAWRTPRDLNYGTDNGDRKKAYATGTIVDVGPSQLLVLPSAVATVAYDITDGQPKWTVYHGGMNASARPIKTNQETILITNGFGKLLSVDPKAKGDATETHVNFVRSKVVAKKSTPVIVDNLAFMISDKGVASCIDAKTGEEHWAHRLGGKFAASPITDGEKILALSESGKIHIFAASETYQSLGEIKFADGFHASPAAIDGNLILRSLTHLYRIKAKDGSTGKRNGGF